MIEYALIAALVAVAVIAVLTTLGEGLGSTFDSIIEKLPGVTSSTDPA